MSINQDFSQPNVLAYLFVAFVLSVLVAAKFGFHLALGNPAKSTWLGWLFGGLACLLVYWTVFDVISVLQSDPAIRQSIAFPLVGMCTICVAAFATCLHLRFPSIRTATRTIRFAPTLWLLIGISCGVSGWSAYRFYSLIAPVVDIAKDLIPPGKLHKINDLVAVTDRGRHFSVAKWEVEQAEFKRFDFMRVYSGTPGFDRVIQRASPDSGSNCHGWVFTGGSFHMGGDGVALILEDNGYSLVSEPKADDLVIYRDSHGHILHTGLVRGVLDEGTVIIESKWSVASRFLHRPEDQPYSQNFTYYRTPRRGHFVSVERVSDVNTSTATVSPEPICEPPNAPVSNDSGSLDAAA